MLSPTTQAGSDSTPSRPRHRWIYVRGPTRIIRTGCMSTLLRVMLAKTDQTAIPPLLAPVQQPKPESMRTSARNTDIGSDSPHRFIPPRYTRNFQLRSGLLGISPESINFHYVTDPSYFMCLPRVRRRYNQRLVYETWRALARVSR